MAKNYIDNLSEEVRKGLHQKAREGMWPSFSPLGYQNVTGPSGKKIMIPDPVLGPVVTRLFERYATGKYSLKEVAVLARADGLVYRKSGDPVPTSTVHKILRNRTYSGDFEYNGAVYHGTYESLVSRELWDEVQAVLDGRRAKQPKKWTHEFPYSGLVTCGHCGCAMVGEIKKGRYIYYHCTGYRGKCPEAYTRQEVLEKAFAKMLEGLSFSAEVLLRPTRKRTRATSRKGSDCWHWPRKRTWSSKAGPQKINGSCSCFRTAVGRAVGWRPFTGIRLIYCCCGFSGCGSAGRRR